ncbi:hypothetical protein WCX72_09815 [Sulfurimonas sp. HSL1-6]|uniref:hypothetical protein n=1 Tax=Thiomicrolovo immobilis TaxID=3131935 RepID=UPI0031F7377F
MRVIQNWIFELQLLDARRRYASTRGTRIKCALAQMLLLLVPVLVVSIITAGVLGVVP